MRVDDEFEEERPCEETVFQEKLDSFDEEMDDFQAMTM